MYRIVKGAAHDITKLYEIAYFPDGLSEAEIKSIEKSYTYDTLGLLEVIDGKPYISFPYHPASLFNRGIDKLELDKWEKIFEAIKQFVDENYPSYNKKALG